MRSLDSRRFVRARRQAEAFVAAWTSGQYERAALIAEPKSFWWFGVALRPSSWAVRARRTFNRRRLRAQLVAAFDHRMRAKMDREKLQLSVLLPLDRRDGMYLFDVRRGKAVVTVGVIADERKVKRVFDPTPLKIEVPTPVDSATPLAHERQS